MTWRPRPRRSWLLLAALLLIAGAGVGSVVSDAFDDDDGSGDSAVRDTTLATDAFGNPLPEGLDWAAGADGKESGSGDGDGGEDDYGCGVPPNYSPSRTPLGRPENDFPAEITVQPSAGDRGSTVSIEVVAPTQPQALVVVSARFFDGKHHGVRAAKFTDLAGRVMFEGHVPHDAPVGVGLFSASVVNQQDESALVVHDFIVTSPECPAPE